jgi:hypothetical protein
VIDTFCAREPGEAEVQPKEVGPREREICQVEFFSLVAMPLLLTGPGWAPAIAAAEISGQ